MKDRVMLTRPMMVVVVLLLAVQAPGVGANGNLPLVEPAWLAERLGNTELVVLDIRNPIGDANRRTYEAGHIPGAVYSNYITDAWHDQSTHVPATLPPIAQLEKHLGRLGIHNGKLVVVVHSGTDSSDFSTAARVYWIFRLLGHERVTILNGGFRGWQAAGLPIEQGWNEPQPASFAADPREELLAGTAEVEEAIRRGTQLIDGRARDWYQGWMKGPLIERLGTIPDAINLEHRSLIEPDTGRFLHPVALASLLREVGIDPDRAVIAFCNIGHWSATIWFALSEVAGFTDVALYDGSMVEWAASPERPVVIPDDPE